jgi:hypothetical protein
VLVRPRGNHATHRPADRIRVHRLHVRPQGPDHVRAGARRSRSQERANARACQRGRIPPSAAANHTMAAYCTYCCDNGFRGHAINQHRAVEVVGVEGGKVPPTIPPHELPRKWSS